MTTQFNASHFGADEAVCLTARQSDSEEAVDVLVNKSASSAAARASSLQFPELSNTVVKVLLIAQRVSQSCKETLSSTVASGVPEQMYPDGGSK